MKIGHCTQVSGVRSENARAGLKPDTRHLKPMLGEGFTTPDNERRIGLQEKNRPSKEE